MITIDLEKRTIDLEVPAAEVKARLEAWKAPSLRYTSGVFQKYVKLVGSAAQGAVTS
jgi:dihydroxy-acid dehydratase